jgi:hypothetical protein
MQDVTFSTGAYGFAEGAYVAYWSSSQEYDWVAWVQRFVDGFQGNDDEFSPLPVRPVRAF